jgi:hypothetical protein
VTGRRRAARAALPLVLGTASVWLATWFVATKADWQPRPAALLTALLLAAALIWLLGAVVQSGVSPLPPTRLRVSLSSPVGEDSRLLRHQMHLEDAAADPPSCRPIVTRIVELARERRRLRYGTEYSDGTGHGDVGAPPEGSHLAAVLDARPPDRTRLSSRQLAALINELEAL